MGTEATTRTPAPRVIEGDVAALEVALAAEVRELKQSDPLVPISVLVGGTLLRPYLGRRLADLTGGHINVRFLTAGDFGLILGEQALLAAGREPLPFLGDRVLARQLAEAATGYFEPVAAMPGFSTALHRTLRELRQAMVDAGKLSGEGEKLNALAGLYEKHEQDRARFYAPDDALLAANPDRLDASALLIYGVWDASEALRSALEVVSARVPVTVFLPRTDTRADGAVAPLRGWLETLDANFEQTGIQEEPREKTALRHLCSSLFTASPTAAPPDDTVHLVSAPDPSREVREAVRACLRWASEGIGFHEMAVVYRNADEYRGLIEASFREADVPLYLHEGSPLSERPLGRRVSALLDLADSKLERTRVMSFLADARLPDETWKRYGHPSATRWDGISREAGVIEGIAQWRDRLTGYAQRLRDRYEEAPAWMADRLAAIETLRTFISDLHATVERRPGEATFAGHLEFLGELLRLYVDDAQPLLAPLIDLQRLDVLDAPMSFARFADMVRTTLASLRSEDVLDARSGSFGLRGVNVLDVNTLRHIRFRAVALLGLSERLFPPPPRQDPLVLDDERERLGVPLRTRGADPEPLQFAVALQSARERLQLSFPRARLGARTVMLPSGFFRAAAGALRGESVPLAQIDALPPHLYERVPASRIGAATPQAALDRGEYERSLLEQQPELGAAVVAAQAPRFMPAREGERARWNSRFTVYDGVLERDGVAALERRGTLLHPMSASGLQSYASCPYRFFLDSVIGVRAPAEPEAIVQIGAMERGSVIHKVLERFMRARAKDPIRVSRREAQIAELLAIAERQCAQAEAEGLTGYEVIWRQDRARILEDLRGWYEAELLDGSAEVFTEAEYELAFGFKEQQPIEIAIEGGRALSLRGFIDRLQWRGSDRGFRVIDYKTGKVWGKDGALDGGKMLQLPLYLHAAAKHLGVAPEQGEAEYFYSTRLGGYRRVRFTAEHLRERAEDLETLLRGMLDAAAAGDFHAEPEHHCDYCVYDRLCDPRRQRIRGVKAGDPQAKAFEERREIP